MSQDSSDPNMAVARTNEPQQQASTAMSEQLGPVSLGPVASRLWRTNPRQLLIQLARYKFCAKMLAGKSSVLEVGCGDGFGSALVLQTVQSLHIVDFDPLLVEDAKRLYVEKTGISFEVQDYTQGYVNTQFDAAFSVDTIEHIPQESEKAFIANISKSLKPPGVCIIGTPNLSASQHGSARSRQAHINLKDDATLRELLGRHFHEVFIFSMNDEVVHTGYFPMAHYLFGLAVGLREPGES